ncbi:MAG: hypothetical protein KAG18_02535 [Sinobacterium sp.]|nr:hypothetical protein [Sinobacterium sp.]
MSQPEELLEQVITIIKTAINEEWVEDFDMDKETSISEDLELESIEFISIAEKLQKHFGDKVNFIEWLGTKELSEIIDLTVGDIVDYVSTCFSK